MGNFEHHTEKRSSRATLTCTGLHERSNRRGTERLSSMSTSSGPSLRRRHRDVVTTAKNTNCHQAGDATTLQPSTPQQSYRQNEPAASAAHNVLFELQASKVTQIRLILWYCQHIKTSQSRDVRDRLKCVKSDESPIIRESTLNMTASTKA